MSTFFGSGNLANNISKEALAKKARLEAEIAAALEADRVRIPEMTTEEKAEIKTLEAKIAKLTPEIAAMNEYMTANERRYKDLNLHAYEMYRAGKDPYELITERDHRLNLAEFLGNSSRAVNLENTTAKIRIETIKENGRAREIQAEQEQK
jgi:hypothetical protein